VDVVFRVVGVRRCKKKKGGMNRTGMDAFTHPQALPVASGRLAR